MSANQVASCHWGSQLLAMVGKARQQLTADVGLIGRVLTYLEPYKQRLAAGLLSVLPSALLNGGAVYLLGTLTDQLVQEQRYELLYWVPVGILVLYGLESVFSYINETALAYVGTALSQDLRKALYSKLNQRTLGYIASQSLGQLQNRYYHDPGRLEKTIVENVKAFFLQLATAVVLTALLLWRSWFMAVVALGIISFVAIPTVIVSKRMRQLDRENVDVASAMFNVFHSVVVGAKVVAIFDLYKHYQRQFHDTNQAYFSNAMSLVKSRAILKPITQMIAAAGIAAILWFGTAQLKQGLLTPGEMTSFLVGLILLYKPIKTLSGLIAKFQRILAPAQRVFEKLDLDEARDSAVLTDQAIEPFQELRLSNVSFRYTDDGDVLKNINLTVKRGQKIALVGGSGGGKSTLMDLIPRFIQPTQGEITINGIPLSQVPVRQLRHHMAMVSQDTSLFDGTIVDNIRLGKLSATSEDISRAIEVAYLQPVIDRLPNGIETSVGRYGHSLSGGQRQRIAIARAYLKQAPILLLDEATSALDNDTEAAIQEAMKTLITPETTVITVAHRLTTITHADCIYVLENGQIMETGTHQQLLDKAGIYANYYQYHLVALAR